MNTLCGMQVTPITAPGKFINKNTMLKGLFNNTLGSLMKKKEKHPCLPDGTPTVSKSKMFEAHFRLNYVYPYIDTKALSDTIKHVDDIHALLEKVINEKPTQNS